MCHWTAAIMLLGATLMGQDQTTAPSPSLLEKLYRLVWPAGRFKGDLVRTVSKNTQKGALNPDSPKLYIVDTRTGSLADWKGGLGAVEPVVCAADDALFYRRESRIFTEPLRVSSSARIESSGIAVELSVPPVSSLVACTADGKASILWIEAKDGSLVRLVRKENQLVPAGPDGESEFEDTPSRALADYLRVMRSIRPDRFTAAVINKVLVGEKPGQKRFLIVQSDSVQFSGVPAWVPDTDSLFITGATGGPQ